MSGLTKRQDAFGLALWDHLHGKARGAVIERDDGTVETLGNLGAFFERPRDWPERQRRAIRLARGRVLDAGCGGGRVALYLQGKGLDVCGIDYSPLAVKACRSVGLKHAKVLSATQVKPRLGVFDTVIMYGNGFGLLGNPRTARWWLRRMCSATSPAARIIAEANDPYRTKDPMHLAYHRRNRRRGRKAGQVRIRVRYRNLATPWFDWLLVSKAEMRQLVAGTGWRVARFIDSPKSMYVAVLEKERQP